MKAATMLVEARKRAGLSQTELAGRTGVKQPAISRIESGRAIPSVEMLDHLLRACGESLEPVRRAGSGIDRSVIRQLLELTPAERLRKAAAEAGSLQRIRQSARS
jgi:transcriptional regulator with XRE-family HTH domain